MLQHRHDLFRDVLFDIFRLTKISVKKETPANFLIDQHKGRLTSRQTNDLAYMFVGRKHAWSLSTSGPEDGRF